MTIQSIKSRNLDVSPTWGVSTRMMCFTIGGGDLLTNDWSMMFWMGDY